LERNKAIQSALGILLMKIGLALLKLGVLGLDLVRVEWLIEAGLSLLGIRLLIMVGFCWCKGS